MEQIIGYILKVILISAALYLFYFLFLRRSTLFKLNRLYLIISLLLPLVLPFIEIPVNITGHQDNILPVMLNEIVVGDSIQNIEYVKQEIGFNYLLIIYFLVMLILCFRMVRAYMYIYSLIRNSERTKGNNYVIVVSKKEIAPFSFFKYLFINGKYEDNDKELQQIISHEEAHILQKHSFDNILSEVICSVFWINPVFWIIKNDLKSTHEYLADEKVMEQGFDPAGYFMLLYNNIVGKRVGFANNLNQSLTLKRLKMMKKERSPRYLRWLYYATAPLVFLSVFSFSCVYLYASEPENTYFNTSLDEQFEIIQLPEEPDTVYNFGQVEVPPVFPSGDEGIISFISGNVTYPKEAKEKGIQGIVYVQFIIEKNGKVTNVKIAKGVDPMLDAEAIRVVSLLPDWIPGTNENGEPVRVTYVVPINFRMVKTDN